MEHDFLKEDLSAYLDGELSPQEKAKVDLHLSSCAECRGELESARSASAKFRTQAAAKAPAGLADRVLSMAGAKKKNRNPARESIVEFAIALAIVLLMLAGVGRLFKPQIAGIFNQVMGMISGAATSVGSGN